MRLVDSHAHLDFPQFDADREVVIERAREAGLLAILNVGADLASSRAAVALADRHDFIYAAVGVHPHDAKTVTPAVLDQLRALARHPKVVAVGEIGLDYYRDLSPRPVQRRVFAQQLALAAELGLPVVVHSREAHDDVLAALRDWQGTGGVLHSYSAGPERLEEVLALGFHIGLSGPITFPKAHRLRTVAAAVALDRLLVETDCPYLTPVPHRGRRNEPAYVRYMVEAVAHARGTTVETVAQATTENAQRLFGLIGKRHGDTENTDAS
ncbi:MAG TPA: TatD family hydrolase [Thermoflexia bacterium]|jgi:TatD DNase family protein|nr:TatD family hydrolase [Thermoflexia bacterium]